MSYRKNGVVMKVVKFPSRSDWSSLLARPTSTYADVAPLVDEVFNKVKKQGDSAVLEYTAKFDKVQLESLEAESSEFEQAATQVDDALKKAIQIAFDNISSFHRAQKTASISVETTPGVQCWQEKRPIQKVGLYIPGGTAPLFSTVLMLAIPAKIAGCSEIILCTPPNNEGVIAPEILWAAQLCGVTRVFKVGGIQAVAAMTFGTQTIPNVYKILGPGNQFVTVAKQKATQFNVSIDMPAGPSELLVVADDSAVASYVASDLLSQAEHGADSQVILVTTSNTLLESVQNELQKQLPELARSEIASKAIDNSKLILVDSESEAIDLIDEYGPEHYIICMHNEEKFVSAIQNAGSVFVGNYTPESAGDYASGTNHTLPTNGYAKQYSGVNLDSFTKSMTFQKISKQGIVSIGETIERMAAAEGLDAHKNAVSIRLNDIKNETY